MIDNKDFLVDEIYGERLLISVKADRTELIDNIRVARVLLKCFSDMYIRINEHLLIIGHKNPEYTINGKLGDRKTEDITLWVMSSCGSQKGPA